MRDLTGFVIVGGPWDLSQPHQFVLSLPLKGVFFLDTQSLFLKFLAFEKTNGKPVWSHKTQTSNTPIRNECAQLKNCNKKSMIYCSYGMRSHMVTTRLRKMSWGHQCTLSNSPVPRDTCSGDEKVVCTSSKPREATLQAAAVPGAEVDAPHQVSFL